MKSFYVLLCAVCFAPNGHGAGGGTGNREHDCQADRPVQEGEPLLDSVTIARILGGHGILPSPP